MLRGSRALLASRRAAVLQFEVSPGLAPGGASDYERALALLARHGCAPPPRPSVYARRTFALARGPPKASRRPPEGLPKAS